MSTTITRVIDSRSSPVATAAQCGRSRSGPSDRDAQSITNRATSSGVAPSTAARATVRSAVVLPGPATAGDQQAAALLEVEHRRVLRLRGRVVEHAERDVAAAAAPLGGVRRQARSRPTAAARGASPATACAAAAGSASPRARRRAARRDGSSAPSPAPRTALRHGAGERGRGDWRGGQRRGADGIDGRRRRRRSAARRRHRQSDGWGQRHSSTASL